MQAIASLSVATNDIPPEFVRSEHEQPGITTYRGLVPEIPVIDLEDGDEGRVTRAIAEASQEWGIFQLVNHGIPGEVIRALQRVGREFFELPPEEKEKYAAAPGSLQGYGTKLQKDLEGKKAWVDFLFHNIWPPTQVDHRAWPENPVDYRCPLLPLLARHYAWSNIVYIYCSVAYLMQHLYVSPALVWSLSSAYTTLPFVPLSRTVYFDVL